MIGMMKRDDKLMGATVAFYEGEKWAPVFFSACFDVSGEVRARASERAVIGFAQGSGELGVTGLRKFGSGGWVALLWRDVAEIETGVSAKPSEYEVFTPDFVATLRRWWGIGAEDYRALVLRCVEAMA